MRVLVADDDAQVRGVVSALLAQAGIEAVQAADGASALALASEQPLEVAIIDWRMRGGGLDLARELIADHGLGGRVIMLTGLFDPRDRQSAVHAGVAYFFVKPPDPDELIAAVRAAAQAEG
jgi:DNA-binding response OmpR family regulator